MKKMKPKKRRQTKQVLTFSVLVFLAFLLVGAGLGYKYISDALSPVSEVSEVVTIEIVAGSTADATMNVLHQADLIHDETIAKYYARYLKLTSVKAGIYRLDRSWTLKAILEKINDPAGAVSKDVLLTIVPGDWARDVADKIEAKLGIDADELTALWNDDAYLDELDAMFDVITPAIKKSGTRIKLEGYLFPETYFINPDWSAKKITERFIAQAEKIYDQHQAEFDASGLTTHQVMILASVVQFEASKPEDMKNVAQVFLNRMDIGMMLQSSVTICYALYEYDSWKDCEAESNRLVDSRYNTYKYTGLPIGPITNPSENAIDAVLNPTPNDYFYFIADVYGDGTVYYAKTYAQHLANIEKYLK